MTNLDEAQKQKVIAWIKEGLKLSDVQRRLESELGLHLTYMEVRFLVDDLKLLPKDQPAPSTTNLVDKAAASAPAPTPTEEEADIVEAEDQVTAPAEETLGGGKISVTVDKLARPGAIVSGTVTFSDGVTANWFLDQYGRLGVTAKQKGYQPPPADLEKFQKSLQTELAKMGY